MSPRIALIAGEVSGDILGAALIAALRARFPNASFFGIAGPRMREAGCEAWFSIESLSVMGLAEVLKHLPRLLRLRADVINRLVKEPPDVFIGIDAPDFNLGVEAQLRKCGIKTVHYVSPSVWAWRSYRVHKIRKAVDLMLTVFPFEEDFYTSSGVPARFIGHPLADTLTPEQAAAVRPRIGLDPQGPVVALLPGSRRSEVSRLLKPFLATAQWLRQRRPDIRFVLPTATPATQALVGEALAGYGLPVTVLPQGARDAMNAADVVLLASGTAALEAMLLERPMVVAYRLHPLTYAIASRMLRVDSFSLPNLLLGERAVPEFTQQDVTPDVLGPALLHWLDNASDRDILASKFRQMRQRLAMGAAEKGAEAIAALLRHAS